MNVTTSLLFFVLYIVLGLIAAFCMLTFTILWYETANNHPELVSGRFTSKRLWFTARLFAGECLAVFCNILLLPFGCFPPRERTHPKGTPVLLLHGLFHNRAVWSWIRFRLRLRGIHDMHSINLPPWKDVEWLTERVANRVDELRQQRGIDRIDLVGHSMGGIIARNYLQIRGGAKKVRNCVLLGAPNNGSKMVPFAVTTLAQNLMPGSPFLNNLNAAPWPEGVIVTNIISRHDNLVLPSESAVIVGKNTVELTGIGHNALLYHSRAFRPLYKALIDADA